MGVVLDHIHVSFSKLLQGRLVQLMGCRRGQLHQAKSFRGWEQSELGSSAQNLENLGRYE